MDKEIKILNITQINSHINKWKVLIDSEDDEILWRIYKKIKTWNKCCRASLWLKQW